jgi:hypothetical protein
MNMERNWERMKKGRLIPIQEKEREKENKRKKNQLHLQKYKKKLLILKETTQKEYLQQNMKKLRE